MINVYKHTGSATFSHMYYHHLHYVHFVEHVQYPLTYLALMGPSLDRICEMVGYVKQCIFNGENRQFYLMQNRMNIINSMVGYQNSRITEGRIGEVLLNTYKKITIENFMNLTSWYQFSPRFKAVSLVLQTVQAKKCVFQLLEYPYHISSKNLAGKKIIMLPHLNI